MVLPLLVDHAQRRARQQAAGQQRRAELALQRRGIEPSLELFEVVELRLKRFARRPLRRAHQVVATSDLGGIGDTGDRDEELEEELGLHQGAVPLHRLLQVADQLVHQALDRRLDHPQRLGLQLFPALKGEQAQRVDHLALVVHDVVELEQPLARLEVLILDALLGLPDGARHPGVGDDLALLGARAVHPARDAVRPEEPHQVVLQRQEEHALAGVALAP